VLRDGLAADSLDPAGIYFGTRGGKLYGSRNEGKTWEKLADGLPQILSVKAMVVNELGSMSNGKPIPASQKRTKAPAAKKKPRRSDRTARRR